MAMKFVVGSNLVVAYKYIKLLSLLSQVYPQDFVEVLLLNWFRVAWKFWHKTVLLFN